MGRETLWGGPESGEQAFEVDRTVGVGSLRRGPKVESKLSKLTSKKRKRKKALNLRFHAKNPTTIRLRSRRNLMTVHIVHVVNTIIDIHVTSFFIKENPEDILTAT